MRIAKAPVLLVEDRRANLEALEGLLANEYELESVETASAALAALEKRDFAVVLLDLQLTTMDAFEAARRFHARATELTRYAPLLVVAPAGAERAEVLRAYAHGAVDLLRKPLDRDVLLAKIAVYAELYRAKAHVAEAERLRLLVEGITGDAIVMLDPNGIVASWNAGAERIKGYTAEEIIGRPFTVFYPPRDIANGKCAADLGLARRDGRFEEAGWRLRRDGTELWANVTITALHDESHSKQLIGFAHVTRDLTERRLAAERTKRFQERFVAILGHDLRNPLSTIDLGVTLLAQRAGDLNDDAGARLLGRMQASSRRMSRMIAQLLDLTRAQLAGGLDLLIAEMNLSSMLRDIVDELCTANPARTIELRAPAVLVGAWDPDRVSQVFSTIVGNAAQYGASECPVTIDAHDEGSGVVVTVHNAGPAIPDAILTELFSAFRSGSHDPRAPETAGLGLGLYLSREIVLAHGGDIFVESGPHSGTTVRVTLPRSSVRARRVTEAR